MLSTWINGKATPGDEKRQQTLLPFVQTAEVWIVAVEQYQAGSSVRWGVGIGLTVAFFLILILTCSLTVAAIVVVTLLSFVLLSVNFFIAFGWALGAAELIILATAVGLGVDHTVHMHIAYLDAMRTSYDQRFAAENSRKAAIGASYLRNGLAVIVSTVSTCTVTLVFAITRIQVLQRMAFAAALIILISGLYSMVFSVAWLAGIGPKRTYRIPLLQLGLVVASMIVLLLGVLALWGLKAERPDGQRAVGDNL